MQDISKDEALTDRNASKIPDKRVIQVYEKTELLDLGMTSMDYQGCNIRIYSKERLLVELIRHMSEYSGAVKPPVRRTGNRQSGQTETAFASLLA